MFDQVDSYHRPRSIREAVRLLHAGGRRARIVAGGTDVIVQADPSIRSLVDITQLGLSYIRKAGHAWSIGATTTIAGVEESVAIRGLAGGILAMAAAACGSVQLRNMATLGGNLANASPAADTAVPLLALDARVVLAGATSRRTLPLAGFFCGPGKTVIGKNLLVEILVPVPPRGGRWGWSFRKLGRTESDISLVSAAAGLQVDARGKCKWVRIALGAVAPTPLRAAGAEAILTGQKLTAERIAQACEQVTRDVSPIGDVRAPAAYRREMARVLAERALLDCAQQAGVTL
jgi:CO/xanthine dehydrogenase FAD-binding subunit